MEIEDIVQDAKEEIESFRNKNPEGVVIIRGATATGKSKLSVILSKYFDEEIISADSRQIFRYMNIGTDKVSDEVISKIPHHQINVVNPDETYTSGRRKNDTYKIISEIHSRKKIPMIVGGTGLYIDTVYKNFSLPDIPPDMKLRDELFAKEEVTPGILHQELTKVDPEEAMKLHPKSTRYIVRALEIYYKSGKTKTETFISQPPVWPLLMLGLRREKEDTNVRINARVRDMLKSGLIEEVQGLLKQGYTKDLQSMQGIGYKEVVEYLEGRCSYNEMEDRIIIATHQLAKKQRSRFRRYIAEGIQSPRENVTYKVWRLSGLDI
ncbi:MAG: tRNA (adenosine(37)-N6)-dimethylallyltransferase MiaA [candidate division SR1 bacterium]|nr:tRNA (adenosine(37)-N6)-dimethylallyltransferase MiaA [candidate division SR1 bacterium]